ncbi:MAG: DNA internalization-related competence protein ComEC/Rec2, partial [Eubacterium sp.]|nr:DNA internalization-related competence protein ComEC/Rec2 [Eubacterium sp.]
MRRPLAAVTLFVALGIIFQYFCKFSSSALLILAAVTFCIWMAGGRKCSTSSVLVMAFLFGLGLIYCQESAIVQRDHLQGQEVQIQGTAICSSVEDTVYGSKKLTFTLVCEDGSRYLVSCFENNLGDSFDFYGDVIDGRYVKVSGKLEKPRGRTNPNCFDYSLYLKSRGIGMILNGDCLEVSSDVSKGFASPLGRVINRLSSLRNSFMNCLEKTVGRENRAAAEAILFGIRTNLDDEVYEEFQLNGTAHVLAASGLHVNVIYGALSQIFNINRRKIPNLLVVLFLCCYVICANFSSSIVRAAIMIFVSIGGKVFHHRYDMITSGALSALILLCINPYNLFNAGFQMSFLAVFIIASVFQKIDQLNINNKIINSLLPVFVLQLLMTPFVIYNFNYFSLSSFVANIPIGLLAGYILPLLLFVMVIFLFAGTLPQIAVFAVEKTMNLFLSINQVTYAEGLLTWNVASPHIFVLFVFYICFFMATSEKIRLIYIRKFYGKLKVIISCVLIVTIFVSANMRVPLVKSDLVFVDVGQGDCLHIKDDDKDILIDGGGSFGYNVGKKVLKPYLLKNRCSSLDLAAATHLHTDHYKGLEELIEIFYVDKVLTEGKAGDLIKVSDMCFIEILWPEKYDKDAEDENENSLIFKVVVSGISVLVTGDITREGEKKLLEKYRGSGKLKADILKVAHHGSGYSSCEEFLREVTPDAAVISVGKNNYGHPSEDVLKKLNSLGIKVFRTDQMGAVGF